MALSISVYEIVHVVDPMDQPRYDSNLVPVYGDSGVGQKEKVLQSFLSLGTTLKAVEGNIFLSTATDDLVLNVTTSPGGSSLGSVTTPAASFASGPNTYRFNFSPAITLTPGVTYYLEFSRSGSRDTGNWYALGVANFFFTPPNDFTPYGSFATRDSGVWNFGNNNEYNAWQFKQYYGDILNFVENTGNIYAESIRVDDVAIVEIFQPIRFISVGEDITIDDVYAPDTLGLDSFEEVFIEDAPTVIPSKINREMPYSRARGDVLITYDYGGSSMPDLGLSASGGL